MTHPRTPAEEGAIEPEGSDADRLEQALGGAPADAPAAVLPSDPEVPVADAWEQAQPVADDEADDERR